MTEMRGGFRPGKAGTTLVLVLAACQAAPPKLSGQAPPQAASAARVVLKLY